MRRFYPALTALALLAQPALAAPVTILRSFTTTGVASETLTSLGSCPAGALLIIAVQAGNTAGGVTDSVGNSWAAASPSPSFLGVAGTVMKAYRIVVSHAIDTSTTFTITHQANPSQIVAECFPDVTGWNEQVTGTDGVGATSQTVTSPTFGSLPNYTIIVAESSNHTTTAAGLTRDVFVGGTDGTVGFGPEIWHSTAQNTTAGPFSYTFTSSSNIVITWYGVGAPVPGATSPVGSHHGLMLGGLG